MTRSTPLYCFFREQFDITRIQHIGSQSSLAEVHDDLLQLMILHALVLVASLRISVFLYGFICFYRLHISFLLVLVMFLISMPFNSRMP